MSLKTVALFAGLLYAVIWWAVLPPVDDLKRAFGDESEPFAVELEDGLDITQEDLDGVPRPLGSERIRLDSGDFDSSPRRNRDREKNGEEGDEDGKKDRRKRERNGEEGGDAANTAEDGAPAGDPTVAVLKIAIVDEDGKPARQVHVRFEAADEPKEAQDAFIAWSQREEATRSDQALVSADGHNLGSKGELITRIPADLPMALVVSYPKKEFSVSVPLPALEGGGQRIENFVLERKGLVHQVASEDDGSTDDAKTAKNDAKGQGKDAKGRDRKNRKGEEEDAKGAASDGEEAAGDVAFGLLKLSPVQSDGDPAGRISLHLAPYTEDPDELAVFEAWKVHPMTKKLADALTSEKGFVTKEAVQDMTLPAGIPLLMTSKQGDKRTGRLPLEPLETAEKRRTEIRLLTANEAQIEARANRKSAQDKSETAGEDKAAAKTRKKDRKATDEAESTASSEAGSSGAGSSTAGTSQAADSKAPKARADRSKGRKTADAGGEAAEADQENPPKDRRKNRDRSGQGSSEESTEVTDSAGDSAKPNARTDRRRKKDKTAPASEVDSGKPAVEDPGPGLALLKLQVQDPSGGVLRRADLTLAIDGSDPKFQGRFDDWVADERTAKLAELLTSEDGYNVKGEGQDMTLPAGVPLILSGKEKDRRGGTLDLGMLKPEEKRLAVLVLFSEKERQLADRDAAVAAKRDARDAKRAPAEVAWLDISVTEEISGEAIADAKIQLVGKVAKSSLAKPDANPELEAQMLKGRLAKFAQGFGDDAPVGLALSEDGIGVDPEGKLSLRVPPRTDFTLICSVEGKPTRTLEISGQKNGKRRSLPVVVLSDDRPRYCGMVVAGDPARPLIGAEVFDGSRSVATTDEDGRFRIVFDDGLPSELRLNHALTEELRWTPEAGHESSRSSKLLRLQVRDGVTLEELDATSGAGRGAGPVAAAGDESSEGSAPGSSIAERSANGSAAEGSDEGATPAKNRERAPRENLSKKERRRQKKGGADAAPIDPSAPTRLALTFADVDGKAIERGRLQLALADGERPASVDEWTATEGSMAKDLLGKRGVVFQEGRIDAFEIPPDVAFRLTATAAKSELTFNLKPLQQGEQRSMKLVLLSEEDRAELERLRQGQGRGAENSATEEGGAPEDSAVADRKARRAAARNEAQRERRGDVGGEDAAGDSAAGATAAGDSTDGDLATGDGVPNERVSNDEDVNRPSSEEHDDPARPAPQARSANSDRDGSSSAAKDEPQKDPEGSARGAERLRRPPPPPPSSKGETSDPKGSASGTSGSKSGR